jgi:acetyl esterase
MRVAPEVQAWISRFDALGERTASLPLAEARVVIQGALDDWFLSNPDSRREIANVAIADHWIPVPGAEIKARIFRPNGAAPHPGLLHFHGGGFIYGTVNSFFNDLRCAYLAAHVECMVITVDYRLAPEHKFPTAFEDCYAGLLWAYSEADELGFDRSRLAIAGESAGGNLAAAVALAARDRGGPLLALQLLEVPLTDLSASASLFPSVAQFGAGYGLNSDLFDVVTTAYLATPSDANSPYASPLQTPDLSRLPPTHVMTAGMDILRDSGEAYAERLARAGVQVSVHRRDEHTHGSSVLWQTWSPARDWMDEVVEVLRRALQIHP